MKPKLAPLFVALTFAFSVAPSFAANRIWDATVNTTWDTTTANWGAGITFAAGDSAIFSSASTKNALTLSGSLTIGSLLSNGATNTPATTTITGATNGILTLGSGTAGTGNISDVAGTGTSYAQNLTYTMNGATGGFALASGSGTSGTPTIWNIASGKTFQISATASGQTVNLNANTVNLTGLGTVRFDAGGQTIQSTTGTGTFNVNSGVLLFNAGGSRNISVASSIAINVASGARMDVAYNSGTGSTFSQALTLNGGELRKNDGGTPTTSFGGTLALGTGGGTINKIQGANTWNIASSISGSSALTLANTGGAGSALSLSGTNTNTGITTLSSGVIQYAKTASLYNSTIASWTAANLNVKSGATLAFNVGGSGEFTTGNVTTLLTNLAASSSATNGMVSGSSFGFDTTNASGGSFTISDAIANSTGTTGGTRGLNKLGTNLLALSGTNTYTGVTTVTAGTLEFAKTAALYSGTTASWTAANLNVSSGATLAFNVGGSGEFTTGNVTTLLTNLAASSSATNGMVAGAILGFDTSNATGGTFTISDILANTTGTSGGARGLTKLGAGTLVLSGVNTYTGSTNVSVGTLSVTGSLGAGTYAGTIANTGVLDMASASAQALSGVISGTGALTKSGAGTLTLSATNTFSGGTTVSTGILDLAGGGGSAGTIRGTATVNSGATLTLSAGDATGFNTDATRLSTINLTGAGVTPGTVGALHVNTTSNQTLGSATINLTGASITGIASSNLDIFGGSSAINTLASATTSTISGVKLNLRQNGGLTLTVADGAAANDLTISSVISNASGFTNNNLTKAGAGTLVLSGTNTYTTATVINAGTLKLTTSAGLNTTSSITVNSGGILEYGAGMTGQDSSSPITLNGGKLLNNAFNFFYKAVTLNAGDQIIETTGNSYNSWTGSSITGSGNLVKQGSSTLTAWIGNAWDYTGATTVNAGTLTVETGHAGLTATSGFSVANGATLLVKGSEKLNNAAGVTLNGGTFTLSGAISETISGLAGSSGTVLNNTAATTATLIVTNTSPATSTYGGTLIDGTGTTAFTKSGTGTQILSSANTHTGGTNITAGTLEVTGSLADTGAITVNGSSAIYKVSASDTVGAVTLMNGATISGAATLTASSITAESGTISAALGGSGSLTKTTAGTLTLSGNSSAFTGTTTVSAGTLLVSGQLGGNVSVSGTLGGGGTIGGNLDFATGSLFDISAALTGNSLSVGGTVTFGSGFGIDNLTGFSWGSVADGAYTLIDTTGTDFSLAGLDNFGSGNAYDLGGGRSAYFNQGSLELVVVPEPDAAALVGAFGVLGLLRRRRA